MLIRRPVLDAIADVPRVHRGPPGPHVEGLTESLAVGYRLSSRGRAYLGR